VKASGRLSLQKHHHRSEHWIVVRGAARVTVNEPVKVVHENESIYIPAGATHRLENPGNREKNGFGVHDWFRRLGRLIEP
jgi:mannose-1-phosphate guanylyltransferase/mannose-6-phosphate isomerase